MESRVVALESSEERKHACLTMLIFRNLSCGGGRTGCGVKVTALAAYTHQDMPVEYLVEVLNPTLT
jgi:hypothetical protein